MLKILLIVIGVLGFVAYTGIDVSEEYETISEIRDDALNGVVDPITKKVLNEAANSHLDQYVTEVIDNLKGVGT